MIHESDMKLMSCDLEVNYKFMKLRKAIGEKVLILFWWWNIDFGIVQGCKLMLSYGLELLFIHQLGFIDY